MNMDSAHEGKVEGVAEPPGREPPSSEPPALDELLLLLGPPVGGDAYVDSSDARSTERVVSTPAMAGPLLMPGLPGCWPAHEETAAIASRLPDQFGNHAATHAPGA